MRKQLFKKLSFVLLALFFFDGIVSANPSHVSINVSGISGSPFQLEIALYDNSGTIGDSWALIDNVVFGIINDNFEDGTIGGFDNSLNPASIGAVSGSLVGSSSYLLRIDEDLIVTPTITFRDYPGSSESYLTFDFEMMASDTSGSFGLDELVFSILDPVTLEPLLPGLTPGFGDVLAVNANGMRYTSDVTVIPAPGALLLGLLGSVMVGFHRRFGRPFNQS
jgi:hypothetical protein